jgi:hypothetical protein
MFIFAAFYTLSPFKVSSIIDNPSPWTNYSSIHQSFSNPNAHRLLSYSNHHNSQVNADHSYQRRANYRTLPTVSDTTRDRPCHFSLSQSDYAYRYLHKQYQQQHRRSCAPLSTLLTARSNRSHAFNVPRRLTRPMIHVIAKLRTIFIERHATTPTIRARSSGRLGCKILSRKRSVNCE